MDAKKILKKAIDKWGVEEQLIILSEECSELSHAALKHRKHLEYAACDKLLKSFDNLAEEIADVEMMIDQIRLALNIGEKISEFRKNKLERLAKILEVEK